MQIRLGMESRGYLHSDMSGSMTVFWDVVGIPPLNLGGVMMGFYGGVGMSGADTQRDGIGDVGDVRVNT